MADSQFQLFLLGCGDQLFSFLCPYCERLLDVDVASPVQAGHRQIKVALRRRRDVHYVRSGFLQKLGQAAESCLTGNLLASCCAIKGSRSHTPTISQPGILPICDACESAIFPQPIMSDLKHLLSWLGSFQRTLSIRPQYALLGIQPICFFSFSLL